MTHHSGITSEITRDLHQHFFKQCKVALAIPIIMENHLPMISTTDDVLKGSRKMNPGFPCPSGPVAGT
jgi:hypothetical protein